MILKEFPHNRIGGISGAPGIRSDPWPHTVGQGIQCCHSCLDLIPSPVTSYAAERPKMKKKNATHIYWLIYLKITGQNTEPARLSRKCQVCFILIFIYGVIRPWYRELNFIPLKITSRNLAYSTREFIRWSLMLSDRFINFSQTLTECLLQTRPCASCWERRDER